MSTTATFKRHAPYVVDGNVIAYQFSEWEVPPKPDTEMTRLLEKAHTDVPLTAEEKEKMPVFQAEDAAYRLGGWCWPMHSTKQLRRILARIQYYGWQEYYAVSKTHLRRKRNGVLEMIYADKE